MRVCIIGAGLAGICATKHCLQNNLEPTVYEKTNQIGGTWVYTDQIGKDEYGLHIHSSMYKGLRTNLPKEIMGFPDFPMPDQEKSYIPAEDVLQFITSYSNHFHIYEHIKYEHNVLNVTPTKSGKWKVMVKNLSENVISVHFYDFIMICNGHYHTPFIPHYPGMKDFHGAQLHSHDFRHSKSLKGETVLIVGSGPSGKDLALTISYAAESVTISHHLPENLKMPENIKQKPDIAKLLKNSVEFIDGTNDFYTVIIYCTGYKYDFPFLTKDCEITVDENFVQPLYKHCINIKYPTMVLIGLPYRSLISEMIDLQIRFVMTYFLGINQLPTVEEMMTITDNEMKERWKNGYKKRHAHMLGIEYRDKYYSELSQLGGVERIKPVLVKLLTESNKRLRDDIVNFRNDIYRLIDDENFIQIN